MNLAVILSGGTGTRMGLNIPKQYLTVRGKPILVYTMEQFQHCGAIDHMIVAAGVDWFDTILQWKQEYGLSKLCLTAPAGKCRQQSIANGLLAGQAFLTGERDGIIIQDAVRPLTSPALIGALLHGLQEAPCVMPVLPMTDTVYLSSSGQWVDGLLDRSAVYAGQAPEAFRYREMLRLYQETPPERLNAMSGSCQLPYEAGWKVKMIPGEQSNIKITYASDLEVCERLLHERG